MRMKMNPKTLDALTEPWLIVPAKLCEIIDIYDHHLKREKVDFKALKSQFGVEEEEDHEGYSIENGVAVMPLEGVISKRMNMFTHFSGGTSTQLFERDFRKAMDDPAVKSILISIDSPGGAVDGVQELANVIFEARCKDKKTIMAYTDGMMASAAYWIGSGAEKIFISGDTTQVGSIGVVAAHIDVSKAEEKMGVKTTEIVAGKYKRIASRYAPLTEEGKTAIQESVDHIYSVFVNNVARNRGVSEEKALSMAEGKVFMGRQSIEIGLTDGVKSFSDLIDILGWDNSPRTIRATVQEELTAMKII